MKPQRLVGISALRFWPSCPAAVAGSVTLSVAEAMALRAGDVAEKI